MFNIYCFNCDELLKSVHMNGFITSNNCVGEYNFPLII